jgi:hypothetical protein
MENSTRIPSLYGTTWCPILTLFHSFTRVEWRSRTSSANNQKTIHTFSQQENVEDRWDDFLHFFVSAHNKLTSIYGFSPEQLHFGFSNPAITDLIEIWPKTIDQQHYAKQIFSQIDKARNTTREKAKAWNKSNITYRNQEKPRQKIFPRPNCPP